MGRLLLAAAVAAIAIGLTAAPVAAKEGVEATLLTPIPVDAAPGDEVTLAWTLSFVDDGGKRQPFNAEVVFVELFSAGGGDSSIGRASDSAHPTGEYEAVVPVPGGGIGGIQIALMGWADGEPSPLVFPITNNPFQAVVQEKPTVGATQPTPAAPEPSSTVSGVWIGALALALVAALAAIIVLLRRGRVLPPSVAGGSARRT
jgi:hypothetical protein